MINNPSTGPVSIPARERERKAPSSRNEIEKERKKRPLHAGFLRPCAGIIIHSRRKASDAARNVPGKRGSHAGEREREKLNKIKERDWARRFLYATM